MTARRTARRAVGRTVAVIALAAVASTVAVLGRPPEQRLGPATSPTAAVSTPAPAATAAGAWLPTPAAARLADSFAATFTRAGSAYGLALAPVGSQASPVAVGPWRVGPAWSTMKVPLSIAALRQAARQDDGAGSAAPTDLVHRAITASDNAAADRLWAGLGGGTRAAAATDTVLTDLGDTVTRTQSQHVDPPYSAYGQSQWSLDGQVRFIAGLACTREPAATAVLREMRAVTPGQRWGLGAVPGAAIKGGWGPQRDGRYVVRQVGLVTLSGRTYAVALAAVTRTGTFDDGVRALDELTAWLRAAPLPTAPPAAARACAAP